MTQLGDSVFFSLVMHLNSTVEETSSVLPHFTAIVVIMQFVCVLHSRCSVSSTDGMQTGFVAGCKLYAKTVNVHGYTGCF
jgi:hypothetical protein